MHPSHPEPLDPFAGQPLIHSGPLGRVEVRGRRDDLQDLVLRQFPGGEQPACMIQPEMQIPRQVQPAAPLERRHAARHRHLGHDLPLDLLRLDGTERRQGQGSGEREFTNGLRLPRSRGVLRDLRLGNGVTQLPLTHGQGVDHVFDFTVTIVECEAGK